MPKPNEEDLTWPDSLSINAWTGQVVPSAGLSTNALAWTLGQPPPQVEKVLAPSLADPTNWRDERVGWGLVLPERAGLSEAQLASGSDAPEPIQALIRTRPGSPIFRYRPADTANRFSFLRDYKHKKDIALTPAVERGIKPGALPRYLLIYGPPEVIPWEFQYTLNAMCAVGRLDLEGAALENYIQTLLTDWATTQAQIDHAVIWAVDYGAQDITRKLKIGIAAEIFNALEADTDYKGKVQFIDGELNSANSASLINALAQHRPALIVTTSHGQTGPLNDLEKMRTALGLPVDQSYQLLDLVQLLNGWQPDGAIWYAHACCSAGSAPLTNFDGLVEAGSSVDQVLKGITQLGATTAPLPRALLGAAKPLRAFIGHVEPTFDWTIRQPRTGQYLTQNIKRALYENLYTRQPLGLALSAYYEPLATLYTAYDQAHRAFNQGQNTQSSMLFSHLSARDLQSMVILGDPTVFLPV